MISYQAHKQVILALNYFSPLNEMHIEWLSKVLVFYCSSSSSQDINHIQDNARFHP